VVDLLVTFLEQWSKAGLQDPELTMWLERFHTDKMTAGRDWWKAVKQGIYDAFNAGAEAIPDALTPGQSNKL